jgi:hypothetical protein
LTGRVGTGLFVIGWRPRLPVSSSQKKRELIITYNTKLKLLKKGRM